MPPCTHPCPIPFITCCTTAHAPPRHPESRHQASDATEESLHLEKSPRSCGGRRSRGRIEESSTPELEKQSKPTGLSSRMHRYWIV
ncbi:hypothetical protein PVL29_009865 [Vitis rotundifolia]|uniref:Uncharacterized protein n=1 Tax=Vitis rotundifolia TaxID=103349 RepID=A0AA38ZSE9_VITRO|nr:hypothetical protein PVL29_009863 [Vitis rotundifolia]KAJ9694087.1 hypothetical protein PVL29_009865 [Vitis rotundifolia]